MATVYRHVSGTASVLAVLQQLPKDMRTTILAAATDKAAEPMKVAAKRNARKSVRTGALFASIDKKTKNYPSNAAAVTIVGPRRGYFTRGGKRLENLRDYKRAESPTRYAHLVEFGHAMVVGGKRRGKHALVLSVTGKVSANGRAIKRYKRGAETTPGSGRSVGIVPPRPFMRPAFLSTRSQVERVMAQEISNGIERTRRKMIKEGAHRA